MGRREENRRRTLLKLGDAATLLFEQRGPKATIEEIAAQAGVSRRTVFRYAGSKEELLYVHPLLWLEIFDRAVAEHADVELDERLYLAGRAISEHIERTPDGPRRAMSLALKHPELGAGFLPVQRQWVRRIAREVCPEPETSDDRFRARIVGSAMMGLVDATCGEWLICGRPFPELWDQGFAHLRGWLQGLATPRR